MKKLFSLLSLPSVVAALWVIGAIAAAGLLLGLCYLMTEWVFQ